MAYKKCALNFTLIDQIVYEIITKQFTPLTVAAELAHFCASNLNISLSFYKRADFTNFISLYFFSIDFKNMFLKMNTAKRYN